MNTISRRELEVIRHAAIGQTHAQISYALGISVHTVRNHLRSVYKKTGVQNRVQLATLAVAREYITHDELVKSLPERCLVV